MNTHKIKFKLKRAKSHESPKYPKTDGKTLSKRRNNRDKSSQDASHTQGKAKRFTQRLTAIYWLQWTTS